MSPLRDRDLETLRLLIEYQRRKVPTVGGVLLFGVDRERHFPTCGSRRSPPGFA